VFGRESSGLPEQLYRDAGKRWLYIPMFRDDARSLNISNCVALVLYEAIRQLGFDGEV
jgi:tRNA (cytidine/uridine-2'-O-)-methyltransferase